MMFTDDYQASVGQQSAVMVLIIQQHSQDRSMAGCAGALVCSAWWWSLYCRPASALAVAQQCANCHRFQLCSCSLIIEIIMKFHFC